MAPAPEQTVLASGRRFGAYEVVAPLGAGGMGEVYKARDTRLDRTVAIKVLPAHVAHDPRSRERFEREARAVAALNHPHICTLHDVGEQDGIDFLVMELLEGETLRGATRQGSVADGARASARDPDCVGTRQSSPRRHRASRSQARQRLPRPQRRGFSAADREAARLRAGQDRDAAGLASAAAATTSPRICTASGLIVGTVQYMAPEQIEGKAVDGAHGHLRVRHGPLRDAHGKEGVRGEQQCGR